MLRLRTIALAVLFVVVAAVSGYVWHITTVHFALITAPEGLVRLPRPAIQRHPLPVWIDTDASCGTSDHADVDDCWAIALAARSPQVAIRGMTTVFGNTDAVTAARVARDVCAHFGCNAAPVIGAKRAGENATAAIEAIAAALRREPLVILSLGPATNVAATLRVHPELRSRVLAVVAIAGGTDTRYFEVGNSSLFHAHDQNFRRDIAAFETLLNARVPVVLVPYATTTNVRIPSGDLQRVPQWLAQRSRGWLAHWSSLSKEDGFIPFDAVAVALLIAPERFRVEPRPVQIRRPATHAPEQFLVASKAFERGWIVSYAYAVRPETRELLVQTLAP